MDVEADRLEGIFALDDFVVEACEPEGAAVVNVRGLAVANQVAKDETLSK